MHCPRRRCCPVDIDIEHRIANVTVPERMLSLAIGREGQNARLAARLTVWRIDIRSDVSVAEAKAAEVASHAVTNGTSEATRSTRPNAIAAVGPQRYASPSAKPKRATKKTAAAADDGRRRPRQAAAARRRRRGQAEAGTTKKAAARRPPTDVTEAAGDAEPAAAAKPKRATKKVAAAEPTEEVAS